MRANKSVLDSLPAFPDPAEGYDPGSAEWAARVTLRIHHAVNRVQEYGIGQLMTVLRYAVPHRPWLAFPGDKPFNDLDRYMLEITGMSWKGLRKMVAGFDEKLAFELDEAKARAEDEYRKKRGRPRKDASENPCDARIKKVDSYGRNADYLLRRIAGEKGGDAILKRYGQGEFPSARAAADAAGIPRPDGPSSMLRRGWKNASNEDRQEFLRQIRPEIETFLALEVRNDKSL